MYRSPMSASIYSDPEFYRLYRSTIEPMDGVAFLQLHQLVEDVVAANQSIAYGHVLEPGYRVNRPHSARDLRDGLAYEVELNGFGRFEGRMVDTRLLTPSHKLHQTVGVTAMVGIAPSPAQRVASLWVMSGDGTRHWVLEHDDGYPITPSESQVLSHDLTMFLQTTPDKQS